MSHDYKKLRSENFAFIDTTNHERVTEQSSAFEMTEKLEEKLQVILTKLEKLDVIKSQLKSYKKHLQAWIQEFGP